ncbi:hypothetical protein V0M98_33195 (plasmid) [Pseudomonas silesiensis]|uniref:hypothetical protein n=1 Tax=Pseudomonas silesiensis TaxID=1853130 RepID=UPI0030D261F8
MQEAHRVKNGCHQWNKLPEGYVNLQPGDLIQAGDVIKINPEYYSEYVAGLLIDTHCSNVAIWFRKQVSP